MRYSNVIPAIFLERPNRFVAKVDIQGTTFPVHVKNTGRCKELLIPDAKVYLEDFRHHLGTRKLLFDLIAVEKGQLLVNMDSQAPNKVVQEALSNGTLALPNLQAPYIIRPETTYAASRFDFYVQDACGKKAFIEVKGVTLEHDGIASFPDAPTERGIKHMLELTDAIQDGFRAYVIFVLQMQGMHVFRPNDERHAAFGEALRMAAASGVHVLAHECAVTTDSLLLTNSVPVIL